MGESLDDSPLRQGAMPTEAPCQATLGDLLSKVTLPVIRPFEEYLLLILNHQIHTVFDQ